MALIGEVYVGDILGKIVLDPRGEEIGRVQDIAVEAGARFPRAVGLFIEKRKTTRYLPWEELSIFNKRIISSRKTEGEIPEAAGRMLAAVEAVIGQLYLVTVVPVVVSAFRRSR